MAVYVSIAYSHSYNFAFKGIKEAVDLKLIPKIFNLAKENVGERISCMIRSWKCLLVYECSIRKMTSLLEQIKIMERS